MHRETAKASHQKEIKREEEVDPEKEKGFTRIILLLEEVCEKYESHSSLKFSVLKLKKCAEKSPWGSK